MLEPPRAIDIGNTGPEKIVCRLPVVQTDVIQSPMRFQGSRQFPLLVDVGEQAVFESSPHLLAFLVFDVPLDNGLADGPYRACVVRATPKRRQPGSQTGKLLPQNTRCVTLESIDDLRDTTGRIGFDKQVNVVRHDFHLVNREVQFVGFFLQQNSQPSIHQIDKHLSSILRTPDNVILQAEYGTSVFTITSFHAYIIHQSDT